MPAFNLTAAVKTNEPLKVRYSMWTAPHLTSLIKGKLVIWEKIKDAREFAEKNGYQGIAVA